jgi:hypothetical protein
MPGGPPRSAVASRQPENMFSLSLISIVIVPVVLGMQAAKNPSRRRGQVLLLALVLTYDVLYVLMLFYLRIRWVDGGLSGGG